MSNIILDFHHTEVKSISCVINYLGDHPEIKKNFKKVGFSKDKECADTEAKKQYDNGYVDYILAAEHKFGQDCVQSLNSGKLTNQLREMKERYDSESVPLFLFIIQEYRDDKFPNWEIISHVDLMRCVGICQDLNIRVRYCSNERIFAEKLIKTILKPEKIIDLGQRFITKSTGSNWNRALQCYGWVDSDRADKIEEDCPDMPSFIFEMYGLKVDKKDFFTNHCEGAFMNEKSYNDKRLENFLKEISGGN